MSLSNIEFARRKTVDPIASRIGADRRRHRRIHLNLLGRFMRSNKREYPCQLVDISVGGASIQSPVVLERDERVIAYFDHIGGIEGQVVRLFDGGFAMRLSATQHKREKLAAQLTWLINRAEMSGIEERRHERVALTNKLSVLKLADGSELDCQVIDISLSGASLGMRLRPELGSEVVLGKQRARVMRHHDSGIGVEFLDMQEPEALRRYFD